jgi:hypothetical protein
MRRSLKRRPTEAPPAPLRARRLTPAAPSGRDRAMAAANLLEGEVGAVSAEGAVEAVLATGETIHARCPAHVDRAWLQAAARVAPVQAAFLRAQPSGTLVLWGIFPGAEHETVAVDIRIRGRDVTIDAQSIQLDTDKAHVRLEREGHVSVRGRDVTSHARRINRIKGGSVRIN